MDKTYLAHYGIKGQRWGVRRFQNEDGSLTSAGRKKYNVNEDGSASLKRDYRRNENVKGALKVGLGTTALVKTAISTKNAIKKGKKRGYVSIMAKIGMATIGSVVVASGVKNFIQANSNKTINTTGMGATPETFTGKAKTQKQVLAAQAKKNQK